MACSRLNSQLQRVFKYRKKNSEDSKDDLIGTRVFACIWIKLKVVLLLTRSILFEVCKFREQIESERERERGGAVMWTNCNLNSYSQEVFQTVGWILQDNRDNLIGTRVFVYTLIKFSMTVLFLWTFWLFDLNSSYYLFFTTNIAGIALFYPFFVCSFISLNIVAYFLFQFQSFLVIVFLYILKSTSNHKFCYKL